MVSECMFGRDREREEERREEVGRTQALTHGTHRLIDRESMCVHMLCYAS